MHTADTLPLAIPELMTSTNAVSDDAQAQYDAQEHKKETAEVNIFILPKISSIKVLHADGQ